MPCSDSIQFKPMEWVRSATLNLFLLNASVAYMITLGLSITLAQTRDP